MYLVRLAYCLLLIIYYRGSPIDVLKLLSNIRNYHYEPHAVNVIIVITLLRSECIQFYNNMFNNNVQFDIDKYNTCTYYIIVYLYLYKIKLCKPFFNRKRKSPILVNMSRKCTMYVWKKITQ